MKLALSHHKHEYLTKEAEHGVKMISQEVQFCLYLILAHSEVYKGQFLVHRQSTLANSISLRDDVSNVT